jgi:hypothetical protein
MLNPVVEICREISFRRRLDAGEKLYERLRGNISVEKYGIHRRYCIYKVKR